MAFKHIVTESTNLLTISERKYKMKYSFITIMILICTLVSLSPALTYTGYYNPSSPAIDGVITAGEWDAAVNFSMVYPDILTSPQNGSMPLPPDYPASFMAPDNAADLSGDVYLTWNDTALYFAVRVYDQDVQATGDYGNLQDQVQFLFNPGVFESHYSSAGDKATLFELDPSATTVNSRNNGFSPDLAVDYAATILADGFVMEFSYDWSYCTALNSQAPKPGDVIKLSWVFLDWENGGYETFMCDSSDNGAWAMTTAGTWNDMLLVATDGCGLNPMDVSDVNSDCIVDMADFAAIASNWMHCTDPSDPECSQ